MSKTSRLVVRLFLGTGVVLVFLGVAQIVVFLVLDELGVVEVGNALGHGLLLWIAAIVGAVFLLLGVLLDLLLGQDDEPQSPVVGSPFRRVVKGTKDGVWVVSLMVNGVMLLGALLMALFLVYPYFPEYFGHYRFYKTCKSLKPGMTLDEARMAMAPFLEVGRAWQPPKKLPGELMASLMEVPEIAAEHRSRIFFIPDARNTSDRCIVSPKNGTIARVDF